MPKDETTKARAMLAAANNGAEVIVRDADGAVFIRRDVAETVIDGLQAALDRGCGFPWRGERLDAWSIVGMNHYHQHGERRIFVSMELNGRCIKAEGADDGRIWAELERQAFLVRDTP